MFKTDVDYRNYFFFEKSNMHGLLGTYTDYVNLRFSHIHDYLGSTIIRDSRVAVKQWNQTGQFKWDKNWVEMAKSKNSKATF